MWTFWISIAAYATDIACPEHGSTAAVDEAQRVEQAFYEVDTIAFDLGRHRLPALITCVDEPMSVLDAVAIHRAQGIIAYVIGDTDASRRAFGAVHVLQPDWRPLPDQLPTDHPLWGIFVAAAEQVADQRELAITALPSFGWSVDGTRFPRPGDIFDEEGAPEGTYGLPADRAFLLQVMADDGTVTYTGYHFSTVDVPVQEMMVRPDPERAAKRRRLIARSIGTTVGGALLIGAAVNLGLGMDASAPLRRAIREDDNAYLSEALSIQETANQYGKIASGLGGAGSAVVGLAWAIPW
jgi:hypothetical protein